MAKIAQLRNEFSLSLRRSFPPVTACRVWIIVDRYNVFNNKIIKLAYFWWHNSYHYERHSQLMTIHLNTSLVSSRVWCSWTTILLILCLSSSLGAPQLFLSSWLFLHRCHLSPDRQPVWSVSDLDFVVHPLWII